MIIGSSNLSFQGLRGRTEVNATFRDESDYTEAAEIFNKLRDEAVSLVDAFTKDEFLETVIGRTWIAQLPAPYLMYIRVLHEYFKTNAEPIKTPDGLTRNKDTQYMNLAYQTDAINDGLAMLRRHSGCIVADVVGLGKSIIGVTIAANAGLKTIIICPPHLRPVSRMGKVLAWGAADYHIGRVLFKRRHRRWYIGKVKFYRFMGKIGVVNI